MSLTTGSGPRFLRVLTPSSERSQIAEWAGGKGRNLHTLSASGFQVPEWSVLGLDVFAEFCRGNGLDERLVNLLDERWDTRPGQIAGEIARLVEAAPFGECVAAAIARAYQQTGGGLVAVRSSGAEEDGSHHSFAGGVSAAGHHRPRGPHPSGVITSSRPPLMLEVQHWALQLTDDVRNRSWPRARPTTAGRKRPRRRPADW
ncbi:PEP/pyruvate-binding domain-containing protein [Streptomyces sp. NPDC050534]|uniref:PEP/pyruvate-binding domain-containing protein n=1 Tax=Streptomyces sp. NPDC050534 TaxID=3365625 RepID=UPI0037A5666C